MDDKEDDEKGFEWISNSNHPRIYATTAVAEQNALSTFNPHTIFAPKDALHQPWPNSYAQVLHSFYSIYIYFLVKLVNHNAFQGKLIGCIYVMGCAVHCSRKYRFT